MILKDVESLEAYGYENPYDRRIFREKAQAEVYDRGVMSTLERLDRLPVCLEWISTRDKLPKKKDWYLCAIGDKILPMRYIEELGKFFWAQCDIYVSGAICWMPDEIDYWADFSKLPIPKE